MAWSSLAGGLSERAVELFFANHVKVESAKQMHGTSPVQGVGESLSVTVHSERRKEKVTVDYLGDARL